MCRFIPQIGFTAAHLVDKGETAVIRAGRVHKDFEGKRLYVSLSNYVTALAKQQGVRVILFATGRTDRQKSILRVVK